MIRLGTDWDCSYPQCLEQNLILVGSFSLREKHTQ